MKLFKRLTAGAVAAILAVTGINALPATEYSDSGVYASAESEDGYFYRQLTSKEKPFYNAMEQMNKNGIFKTGDGDFDLIANNMLTEDEIVSYVDNYNGLLSAFGAARDAFYADHADIFYVDFSYLSIRVTSGANGYHAYIGTGRGDSYYTEGFTCEADVDSALSEYEAVTDEVVKQAMEVTAEEGESLDAKRVEFVHDYITTHTSYRLENACKPQNIGFIRTAYGSLVKGEAVCEGYSRAFKAVLDRLDIPCVLVSGIFRHSENVPELHMWTNVLVDGKWYGVDPTMDDPINNNSKSEDGLDGYEGNEYLLVGESVMSRQHFSSGVMSEANYEFTYPIVNTDDFGFETVTNKNGLVVKYSENSEMEDVKAGEFRVSYRGMGVASAKKEGWYFVVKMAQFDEDMDNWSNSDWAYILPDVYPSIKDSDTEVSLIFPQVRYAEFAVTDVAPGPYTSDPNYLRYMGDPYMFEATSGVLYNPSGTYVAPPYIKRQSPAPTGRFTIDGTSHHVVAEYDDILVKTSEDVEVSYVLDCVDRRVGITSTSGINNSKIENFEWDGKSTISFDFTPSQMWADDTVIYSIYVKGLVGQKSGKEPNCISYCASYPCAVCAYRSQGYKWNVFGKPTLLENSDISTKDWTTNTGEPIDESLMSRLVLVATSPTHSQTDVMNDMIDDELAQTGAQALSSTTYNINLTVCKSQVVSTGDGVRVSLGFPDGYGPEDAGVTFKAYHFIKNDMGEIEGIEEIPCVLTPYGLLVTCKSFSPFAVVAVAGGEEETNEKTVVLSSTEGGSISGADSMTTLSEGESVSLTVSSDKGYNIDAIVVNGEYVKLTDNKEMTVTVSYEDIAGGSCIVDAQFVAESVTEKEADRGEEAVLPQASAADITIEYEKVNASEGGSLTIKAEVSEPGDANTYQWYKDGEAVEGQTAPTLTIDNVTSEDAGEYTLVVTTVSGTVSAVAEKTVTVEVSPCLHEQYGEWSTVTEPTCTADGLESHTCESCGREETRVLTALGHDYKTVVVEPTCVDGGYTRHECGRCGDYYDTDAVSATGHTETVIGAKEATCTENGYSGDTVCEVCQTLLKSGSVTPMISHSFVDGKCEVCGAVETDISVNTGDNDDNGDNTVDNNDDTLDNGSGATKPDIGTPPQNVPGTSSGDSIPENGNPNTGRAANAVQLALAALSAAVLLTAVRKKK